MSRMHSPSAVCARIADRLAKTVGSYRYGMFFDRSARMEYNNHEQRLDVAVPNRFIADWIGRNFEDELREAANQELGCDVDLRVSVNPQQFEESRAGRPTTDGGRSGLDALDAKNTKNPSKTRKRSGKAGEARGNDGRGNDAQTLERPAPAKLPARKTQSIRHQLEGFVVGPSNQLAFAAAQAIAQDEADGLGANPLFVHGDVGLGKTHLLQGICHLVQQIKPSARVLYTTGERFTNDYITAVRANNLEAWRKSVRRLDLLAIDDVHFMANKNKTQQEFLHCFDAIEMNGKRIVMASDSHPKLIRQFSEALVSRCMRGMVVEIQSPDTDTRVRIIESLADRRGISLLETVPAVLASRCQGSIRELEGTLTKLHALASLTPNALPGTVTSAATGSKSAEQRLRIASAARSGRLQIGHTLVNQLFNMERRAAPRKIIRFDTVLEVVSDRLQVRQEDVLGRGRQRHVVLARSLTIYLTRELTSMSFPEIAQAMGRTSHSTIVTAASRIDKQMKQTEPVLVSVPGVLESVALVELFDRLRYAVEKA